jgi:hypothetical protein
VRNQLIRKYINSRYTSQINDNLGRGFCFRLNISLVFFISFSFFFFNNINLRGFTQHVKINRLDSFGPSRRTRKLWCKRPVCRIGRNLHPNSRARPRTSYRGFHTPMDHHHHPNSTKYDIV